jgi:hypothetical protein
VVKLMLRSYTSHNATLISLVHENLMYKKIAKEILEKSLAMSDGEGLQVH